GFFFQAEDGIRAFHVTGVQTCALPILMTGLPLVGRLVVGLRRPRSRVRGMDVAGVVEAVGPGVRRLGVGDAVFGIADGAFAERAVGKESQLVPLPPGVAPELAAASVTAGVTAFDAIEAAPVHEATRVAVTGAGGGV